MTLRCCCRPLPVSWCQPVRSFGAGWVWLWSKWRCVVEWDSISLGSIKDSTASSIQGLSGPNHWGLVTGAGNGQSNWPPTIVRCDGGRAGGRQRIWQLLARAAWLGMPLTNDSPFREQSSAGRSESGVDVHGCDAWMGNGCDGLPLIERRGDKISNITLSPPARKDGMACSHGLMACEVDIPPTAALVIAIGPDAHRRDAEGAHPPARRVSPHQRVSVWRGSGGMSRLEPYPPSRRRMV